MLREREFYAAQAEVCRAQAEEATLANVRAQCLSAERAWTNLAQRANGVETRRSANHRP